MTAEEKNKMKDGYKKTIRKMFTAAKREYRVKLKTFELITDALMTEGMVIYPVNIDIKVGNGEMGHRSGTFETEDFTTSVMYVLDILDIKYQIDNGNCFVSQCIKILPNQAVLSRIKSL